jgi:EAL domain-containing protein (putative c-di-GMP-specific phosphodiesterase class I)
MAHGLGIDVVAEGIETERQAERLRELGCDRGQGFLFARPMPVERVTALLRRPGLGGAGAPGPLRRVG